MLPETPLSTCTIRWATDPGMAPPAIPRCMWLVPVPNLQGAVDWSREMLRYREVVLAPAG